MISNNLRFQQLDQIKNQLFNDQKQLNPKIKFKRQAFLLKLPLYSLIYQKKGGQNFQSIVNSIKLIQYEFGDIIFQNQQDRTFNYILKGTVLIFSKPIRTTNSIRQINQQGHMYARLGPGDHFGQKLQLNKQELIQSARCVSKAYILQLQMNIFYFTFSGHFKYNQLRDKINMLKNIWIFVSLNYQTIQRILLSSQTKKYIKNTVIYKQKQKSQNIWVIIQGQVTLYKEGRNKPLCILGRGQILGIDELFSDKIFDHSAICSSDSIQLLKIQNNNSQQIIQRQFVSNICKQRLKKSIKYKQTKGKDEIINSIFKNKTVKKLDMSLPTKSHKRYHSLNVQQQQHQTLDKEKILNQLFDQQIQLKQQRLRTYKLAFIKTHQTQKKKTCHKLSTYFNFPINCQKTIMQNYIQKKQKLKKSTLRYQTNYKSEKFFILPQFNVAKSSAVKNQKRKLKNSRKMHQSMYNEQCEF